MSSISSADHQRSAASASIPGTQRVFSSLPTSLTSFIGRDVEIGEVLALLDAEETRLLTLTGPGGVGKTRLALEVARRVEDDFADGIIYLRLASMRDPDLVLSAVAQSFGVKQRGDRPLIDFVVNTLHDLHVLLVLDNFEHLLAQSPAWLPELLELCPRLTVLVTSRIPLNMGGEQRYLVPPLPVPDAASTDEALQTTSVRLFMQRATAVRPEFVFEGAVSASVSEICRKVDGLPLAIELAAARVSSLSPSDISSRLTDRLSLLTGGQRDAPVRLRSMRDAIAWSYDLLAPDEQRLFQQLSVFVGGFTLEAAETVVGSTVVDGVASLVDKSLLRLAQRAETETRYLMLETIREFGAEQLAASGEQDQVRDRHAAWYRDLASAGPSGFHSFVHLEHVERLEAEHGNLRAALTWLDISGQESALAELVSQLQFLWYLGAHWSEGMHWHQRVFRQPHDHSRVLVCDLARGAALIAHVMGSDAAVEYAQRAMAIARETGDIPRQAECNFQLALVDEDTGNYAGAEAGFKTARQHYAQMEDRWGQYMCDYHLGVIAYGSNELDVARRRLEAVAANATDMGAHLLHMWCMAYLILIACDKGDCALALELLGRQRSASQRGVAHHWETLIASVGVIASACEKYECAARLFGALAALRQGVRADLPEETTYERARERARQHLGKERFETAWDIGGRMRRPEIDDEIDRLLTGAAEQPGQPAWTGLKATGLSPRELEVLRLIADGLTNREIADTLFISHRTVARHSMNILGKLDLTSRTAAVAWAIRSGLA